MAIDPDLLVDRRQLKRRLALWRVLAVLFAVVAVAVAASGTLTDSGPDEPYIARLTVSGIIVEESWRNDALASLVDDDNATALVVSIDSPGGTAVGGEDLYKGILRVRDAIPVAVVMGGTAASAGYMAAVAGDRLFARESTLTGSIGVIMQSFDVTRVMDKIGVRAETIKSSPLKATPNPFEPLTEGARQAAQDTVDDIYRFFVDLVADQRSLDTDSIEALADGRVFTGRQAMGNGLIDAIGDEKAAIEWLVDAHDIDPDLPIHDLLPPEEDLPLVQRLLQQTMHGMVPEILELDGLVSLWHP